jgi:uncharacterized protein
LTSTLVFFVLLKIGVGAFVGFAIGLTGVGGGVLLMPALTLVIGLPPVMAVGTANLFNLLAKSYAFYEHYRLKTIRFKASWIFLAGAIPGAAGAGILLNAYVQTHRDEIETVKHIQEGLRYVIAGAIITSLILLLVTYAAQRKAKHAPLIEGDIRGIKLWFGLILCFIAGALIGLTSVGGGALVVPILLIFFGLSVEGTVGSSIFIALMLMLTNTIVYGFSGQTDWRTALLMVMGAFGGIALGSRMAVKVTERTLRWIIVSVIFVAAVLILIKPGGH